MEKPITITSLPPVNKGMDYNFLRKEGVSSLQKLSGAIWTDYNEHDPGVTILEQLCYAITDLCYRCNTPIKDLLTDSYSGRIDAARRALYIPRYILPCEPWTVDDYRKFIFDSIPKLGNVWFTPLPVDEKDSYINGLYEIWLYLPSWFEYGDEYSKSKIEELTIEAYCSQRNLCENVASVNILELPKASLKGKVNITADVLPEQVLAKIFFAVSLYFAPGIRRYSLKDMVNAGYATDEIFNGPPIQNGFIKDSDLNNKPLCYSINQIIKNIMNIKGVKDITMLDVESEVEKKDDCLHVSAGQLLDLTTEPDPNSGGFPLILFRNGQECNPNPILVFNELKRLRDCYFRTYNLDMQYEKYFAIPDGQYRNNVGSYYSIQNQFPAVYAIGPEGLAYSESEERKGKAKQLKAYLLVFEQIMADFLSQLENIKEFFSIETEYEYSYFLQYLNGLVPDVEPILKKEKGVDEGAELHLNYDCLGYKEGLRELVYGMDKFHERRNRLLDFLLALYGEEIGPDMVKGFSYSKKGNDETIKDLFIAKIRFLTYLIAATGERGKAFNYLKPEGKQNITGLLIKIRILLGIEPYTEFRLVETLNRYNVTLYSCEENIDKYNGEDRADCDNINEYYEPVVFEEISDEDAMLIWKKLTMQCEIFHICKINDNFLFSGDDIQNYKIAKMPSSGMWAVYFICPVTKGLHKIGVFYRQDEASLIANTLAKFTATFKKDLESVHIVELPLLARLDSVHSSSSNPEEENASEIHQQLKKTRLSYTIIVLYTFSSSNPKDDEQHSKFVEQTIRNNTPAHILPYISKISPKDMLLFEIRYKEWKKYMADPKNFKDKIESTSKEFIKYLMKIIEK